MSVYMYVPFVSVLGGGDLLPSGGQGNREKLWVRRAGSSGFPEKIEPARLFSVHRDVGRISNGPSEERVGLRDCSSQPFDLPVPLLPPPSILRLQPSPTPPRPHHNGSQRSPLPHSDLHAKRRNRLQEGEGGRGPFHIPLACEICNGVQLILARSCPGAKMPINMRRVVSSEPTS